MQSIIHMLVALWKNTQTRQPERAPLAVAAWPSPPPRSLLKLPAFFVPQRRLPLIPVAIQSITLYSISQNTADTWMSLNESEKLGCRLLQQWWRIQKYVCRTETRINIYWNDEHNTIDHLHSQDFEIGLHTSLCPLFRRAIRVFKGLVGDLYLCLHGSCGLFWASLAFVNFSFCLLQACLRHLREKMSAFMSVCLSVCTSCLPISSEYWWTPRYGRPYRRQGHASFAPRDAVTRWHCWHTNT